MRALLVLALIDVAHADPCADVIEDPIATPLHDVDRQRGGCLREELAVGVNGRALIDTPNFHGVLGGDAVIELRIVRGDFELSARYRLADFQFAQTAVNKATELGTGPLLLGAARMLERGVAVFATAEIPYSRFETSTVYASGHVGLAYTGALSAGWRLHARMGYVVSRASSAGGVAILHAPRAGFDLAWHPKRRWAFLLGTDAEAGWRDGFSTLLVRGGISWRLRGGAYRLQLAGAAPLGGDEPTTAIAYLGLARDL